MRNSCEKAVNSVADRRGTELGTAAVPYGIETNLDCASVAKSSLGLQFVSAILVDDPLTVAAVTVLMSDDVLFKVLKFDWSTILSKPLMRTPNKFEYALSLATVPMGFAAGIDIFLLFVSFFLFFIRFQGNNNRPTVTRLANVSVELIL